MEIWNYQELESQDARSVIIAERLARAALTILTPIESAVLFGLYYGNSIEQIAEENGKGIATIYRIKIQLAEKLAPIFEDFLEQD